MGDASLIAELAANMEAEEFTAGRRDQIVVVTCGVGEKSRDEADGLLQESFLKGD